MLQSNTRPLSSAKTMDASTKAKQDPNFKYYGRHGNQWLFNDFSVTGAVSKGFRKVFRRESENEGDWYEKRN
jgi:hypothetical protein